MSLDRLELVGKALIDALVHMLPALHGLLLEPHGIAPQLPPQYPAPCTLSDACGCYCSLPEIPVQFHSVFRSLRLYTVVSLDEDSGQGGKECRWPRVIKLEDTGARFRSAYLLILKYISQPNFGNQDRFHAVMLPSAPCSPLLLFPIVDIVLTLVAFLGEFPSLMYSLKISAATDP